MSEEKKASEKILERLNQLETNMKTLIEGNKPQPTISTSPLSPKVDEAEAKTHKTLQEMIDCPDCFPEVRAKVLQKHRDNTKDEKLECERCGSGVKEEWKECPVCGGSKAKQRD